MEEERKDELVTSPWMKAEVAAPYLGVSIGTLRNWTSARYVPFAKRGRVVRYHRDALDRWLHEAAARAHDDRRPRQVGRTVCRGTLQTRRSERAGGVPRTLAGIGDEDAASTFRPRVPAALGHQEWPNPHPSGARKGERKHGRCHSRAHWRFGIRPWAYREIARLARPGRQPTGGSHRRNPTGYLPGGRP